jgi:hypothetical protein
MSHFAKVENGIVTQVIVAEQDVIDSGLFGTGWVQTSYNTYAGVHRLGGTPLRKNYAGLGFIYDSERDAFYAPAPFPSWVLDEDSCTWIAPVEYPIDGVPEFTYRQHPNEGLKVYTWDESIVNWRDITSEVIERMNSVTTTDTITTDTTSTDTVTVGTTLA